MNQPKNISLATTCDSPVQGVLIVVSGVNNVAKGVENFSKFFGFSTCVSNDVCYT